MSPTAVQSPPTRRCPQCQAPLAPEQDWCLECGTDVSTRIARPPGWGLPVAIVAVTLAVVAAVAVIALSALQDDADRAAGPPGTGAAAPGKAFGPARGGGPSSPAAAGVPLWPAHRRGYTIVVAAPSSRAVAVAKARAMRRLGRDAGILRSDDYDFLGAGLWVVWRGRYATRDAAERAEINVRRVVPSAYATAVRSKMS